MLHTNWNGLYDNGKPLINSFARYLEMLRLGLTNSEVKFSRRGWAYEDATPSQRAQLRRRAIKVLTDAGWQKAEPLWATMRNPYIAYLYKQSERRRAKNSSFGVRYTRGEEQCWVNFKTIEGIVDGSMERRYFACSTPRRAFPSEQWLTENNIDLSKFTGRY